MKARDWEWAENNLPLLLAGFVILLLVIVIQSFQLPEMNRTVKVGCVLIGDKADKGWNESHYSGLSDACREHGCKLIVKDSVPEDKETVLKVVDSLVAEGCNAIYLPSLAYGPYVDDMARKHPRVAFFSLWTDSKARNCTTYFARMYEVRYLAGIIAGAQSRAGVLGYVAAMSNPEMNRNINAFAMGIRRVNPEARLIVRVTGGWSNEEKERESVALFAKEGVDVVTYHQDCPYVVREAEKRGLFSIGHDAVYEEYSDRFLTATMYDWKVVYEKVLGDYLSGRTNFSSGYWLGIEENAARLHSLSPLVSDETANLVEQEKHRIMFESSVFSGIIYDNRGNLRCDAGESIKDYELLTGMDWFAEGVEIYE